MQNGTETFDILLVEDNPGDAKLVKHHLAQGSLRTHASEIELEHLRDMESALDTLADSEFDLILLDLGLPGSSGLETLDAVRDVAAEIPIVVLTGLDDTETSLDAIHRGAQDYLPKDDLDSDTLMRSLRYAIEREKQEQELRRRTEQLEFFNSVLGHDVQNGMDVIRRNAQILKSGLQGDERDRAETIVDWSNDMIDLSKRVRRMLNVVTGTDERSYTPVDLTALLDEQADTIEGMGESVSMDISAEGTVAVLADEMLATVLNNILTNAVEHNDTDAPQISVDLTEHDQIVEIKIADNGPGIPESDRERILARGEKGAPSSGSGFGLYFVDIMIESYGGTLSISDNEPRGTIFTIELPAA